MKTNFITSKPLPAFELWEKTKDKSPLYSFEMEITERCNNDCTHCYINLPAGDNEAKRKELSLKGFKPIVDEAVEMGAMWCLLTGGEPLLREDFFDIYLYLKKKGLLISVFTNATLITEEHIKFFKKYPPRDIEVTVYGVTEKTYEKVTRRTGTFKLFMKGLERVLKNNIKVRFKAMALRSNVHELPEIARFCRERTKDYFRFDPFLHLRYDRNEKRNKEIISERLSPKEIIEIEKNDSERFDSLKKSCDKLIMPSACEKTCNHLFYCGAGQGSFNISSDGIFRLCSSLFHPSCVYDLKRGSLKDAWYNFVPKVREFRSDSKEFLERCHICPLINLCIWCPAHAHLETGEMDRYVEYFCSVAQSREKMLTEKL
ncbi:MAG TPA: radical SAM protein [Candidatus Eremiobacteraeota bacterium]|nr:MAG: Antilisterial bacteriocin subtilosin biosynthesis protein AlbA [bacterium ADurb.Bin363]HPZ09236.1 radical SAM protein [Candidatus Eremiobacteraeota bacterium]